MFVYRNDVPLEYSNEEQSISAVGLVKPRPNVFHDAVQYVLVVCTTTEVRTRPEHALWLQPQLRATIHHCPMTRLLSSTAKFLHQQADRKAFA